MTLVDPPNGAARPRVLISAYACGPDQGPEATAGWALARAAAETGDVWILTRERFRESLSTALAASPELAARVTVVHIDLPARVMRLKRRGWDLYWYYALWQRLAGRTAARLHADVSFDVAHHVSFANDWLPCGISKLDVPVVWGPVGGASRVPIRALSRWLGVRGTVTEVARTALTALPRAIWGDATARRAALVVAQNPDVAHRFRRAKRVVVEPNAAFAEEIPPHRGSESGRTAVFAGRLLAWKGAALAIETISRPAADGWRLLILGEGYERARLQRLAKTLGVGDRVEFLGHLPREETLDTLAASDALLFPSMHDQAGWIVGEASAMGLPVVCLDLGGPPTLADINARVVQADAPDLPDRLAETLRDSAAAPGRPHRRWAEDRLPAIVGDWYATAMGGRRRPLAVMESLTRLRPTTNPYLVQLCEALDRTPGIDLSFFSWKRAILGRLDVLHVHWPELLVGGHRLSGRIARRILTAVFLVRARLTGVAIVRTLHNLERPSDMAKIDLALLDAVDRLTTLTITLNDDTPLPEGHARRTILHGHYRDWFASYPTPEAIDGRMGYVGLIRRYKGVEQLIEAFRALDADGSSLSVAGRPSTDDLEAELIGLAGDDARVEFHFRFLDDAELVARISEAEFIVLPYRHMHNSGTALAALSVGRAILVPDNTVNRALAIEVGERWVHLFDGELTDADLARVRAAVAAGIDGSPDLSQRDWSTVGAEHSRAFHAASALRKARR
ncbi:glycosyltransferase [Microbacterium oxydans]|uniref:GDP-mannose:glycolipid 4-beta-D-mannosyltransferase n=1 Tax=Microbacterium oxydans TaxID=82380 RepID=A0A0F0L8J7_9MICO|nr:glycosyltransferase [Microbacterium oxydans]KJL29522.1 GDP-mannose:glycolipid 4-beta-D-mannosyltransferase precursor [Microbacterium oxydans]